VKVDAVVENDDAGDDSNDDDYNNDGDDTDYIGESESCVTGRILMGRHVK
jgi:hypothetical protein